MWRCSVVAVPSVRFPGESVELTLLAGRSGGDAAGPDRPEVDLLEGKGSASAVQDDVDEAGELIVVQLMEDGAAGARAKVRRQFLWRTVGPAGLGEDCCGHVREPAAPHRRFDRFPIWAASSLEIEQAGEHLEEVTTQMFR